MSSIIRLLRRHRNLVLLLVSGLVVPLITELASSWLEATFGRTPSRLVQLLAVGVALAVGLWVLALALHEREQVLVPREQQPPKFPGLIVLVGPGRPGDDPMKLSHSPAIEYHLAAGPDEKGLRVCWLIATAGVEGAVPVAEALRQRYGGQCTVIVRSLGSAFNVQAAYEVVERIYTKEAAAHDLSENEVIADFTGGTKPMSAGMILACGEQRPMQYMTGRRSGVASVPMLVQFKAKS
jgi:hypothetical protein